MPLHPQVEAFLQMQAAAAEEAGIPPITEQTPEMARAGYAALGQSLGSGEDVETLDRTIPGPAGEIPIRVYSPDGEGPHGVLVYYHGGGWVIGDLDTHDHACRALCHGAGCVVVSVDYRLAPEHRFPAAVDDSWAAFLWVAENAAEIDADPERIAVGGDSAGGNLAAVVSILARDAGGPTPIYQLLVYPGVDMKMGHPSVEENGEGLVLTKDHMHWFRAHYLGDGLDELVNDPRVSPLAAASHENLPPAHVVTAEYDPLRDEGEAYAKALEGSGVPVTVKRWDGMVHVFFQLVPILDDSKACMQDVCERLKKALL